MNPAFTVYDPRPGRSSRDIRFTMVISNIGGHYNTTTGEYTCHVSGLYYFVLHILKNNRSSSAYCYIRKNRTGFVSALTNPDRSTESGYNGASNSMIVQLDRGDIIDTYCSDFNTLFTGSATSFSGFLLKAD